MITNITDGIAVAFSPSHANVSNRSRPRPVRTPLSRPAFGSYICAQIRPTMIAGTT